MENLKKFKLQIAVTPVPPFLAISGHLYTFLAPGLKSNTLDLTYAQMQNLEMCLGKVPTDVCTGSWLPQATQELILVWTHHSDS